MKNNNLRKLTIIEKVLLKNDYEFCKKKYNSKWSRFRNKIHILFTGRRLTVLERINYSLTASFFTDIGFKANYLDISGSIKPIYKFFGITKIYYKDIIHIHLNGKTCIIQYREKGQEKSVSSFHHTKFIDYWLKFFTYINKKRLKLPLVNFCNL